MNKRNPYYSGPETDHFDGFRFLNATDKTTRTAKDLWAWMRNRQKKKWPTWVELGSFDRPPERSEKLRISFVNHVTFLIQIKGANILTDPLWSLRASPSQHFGPKRVHAPGIKYQDLPKIDYVLISHTHYDHLDMPCLKKLVRDHNPVILTGLGVDQLLAKKGIKAHAFEWWGMYQGPQLKVHFVPSFHWSSRSSFDRNFTLWGGFVIEIAGIKIYFAGDTGFDQGRPFQAIFDHFGAMDVSLLPIGAYEPRWFMALAHMNPEEAVMAHKILKSHTSIAMHYGCFQLTDEGIDDPVVALVEELVIQEVSTENFRVIEPGKFIEF